MVVSGKNRTLFRKVMIRGKVRGERPHLSQGRSLREAVTKGVGTRVLES